MAVFMLWVILSISIKILTWPHMLSLRLWASRPVLICMSGLDNVWGLFQSEKKPLILLYKWDHIPPTKNWWFFFFKTTVFLLCGCRTQRWKHVMLTYQATKMEYSFTMNCPLFLHWPQRISLSCKPFLMQLNRQILGSDGILSFLIWMAILSQCEGKTSGLPISLILSLQKLVNPFTRLNSSHLVLSSPQNTRKMLSGFFTNLVVFQHKVIPTK